MHGQQNIKTVALVNVFIWSYVQSLVAWQRVCALKLSLLFLNVSHLLIHLQRLWNTAGRWRALIDCTPSSFVYSLCIRSAFYSLTQWEHSGMSCCSDCIRDISDSVFCHNFCRLRHFIQNSLLSQIMLNRIVLPYTLLLFFHRES